MIRVKVCGITRRKDALHAAELGAHALGFVFYRRSARYVDPEKAAAIIRSLPPFVATVGVFVDAPLREVRSIANRCRLSAVQLHGGESPEFCGQVPGRVIKAFRVQGPRMPRGVSRFRVDALLLDTYKAGTPGGTGEVFPWEVAARARRYGRVILAGGLHPGNVGQAVSVARPYAVDVSSGVEVSPGKKDPVLVEAFLKQVSLAG